MSHDFTPAILIHLVAALAALGLGAGVFLRRKGTPAHRLLGRAWVALMLVTVISTWWIRTSGGFSWIHLLSVGTFTALCAAVFYAVTGRIARHRRLMAGTYAGALVIAGLFTLLPQRLLGRMLWEVLGLL